MKTNPRLIFSALICLLGFFSSTTHAAQGRFSVGDSVITSSNDIGTITGFPDPETARVKFSNSKGDYLLSGLSKEVPEYDGIRVSTKVIDSSNNVGTTLHVFEDGRIQYQFQNYKEVSKNVSPEIEESNFIRVGTKVIDPNNAVGLPLLFFGMAKFNTNSRTIRKFQIGLLLRTLRG